MLDIPDLLQERLSTLPKNLQAHIERVREIARSLSEIHGVDPDKAELAAAGHDVARHISPEALLKYALDSGLEVNPVEQRFPILLHGPVGSAWLEREGSVTDQEILHSIRWHTTGHPNLSPLGQIVFLADKLDPNKERSYPFQETVKQAARIKLSDGMTEFLNGILQQQLVRGDMIHPVSIATRNHYLAPLCDY